LRRRCGVFHGKDVLHRDLKASNNILCDDHNLDRHTGEKQEAIFHHSIFMHIADYESSVGVVGTPFWRAPEILQQLKEKKPRVEFPREADVYNDMLRGLDRTYSI
jgi:serine/threonine protein kinase